VSSELEIVDGLVMAALPAEFQGPCPMASRWQAEKKLQLHFLFNQVRYFFAVRFKIHLI